MPSRAAAGPASQADDAPSSDDVLALLQSRLEEGLPSKAEAVGHGVLDGQSLTDIMGFP